MACGDSAYGSATNLNWLVNEKRITPYIPVIDKSKRADGTFSREDFVFDAERNVYTCPAGKMLTTTGRVHPDHAIRYFASVPECRVCPLKPKCCPNMPARRIVRDINEEARDVARINCSVGPRPKPLICLPMHPLGLWRKGFEHVRVAAESSPYLFRHGKAPVAQVLLLAFIREPVASSAGEQRARAMSKPDVPAAEAPKTAEPPPVTAVAPAPRVVLPGAPAERPESAGESRGVALPTARARCRAAGGTRLAAE